MLQALLGLFARIDLNIFGSNCIGEVCLCNLSAALPLEPEALLDIDTPWLWS